MKKFNHKLIAKDLRFKGRMISTMLKSYSPKKIAFFEKATSFIYAGRARSKAFIYKQIKLPREDGSKLRVCIYSPKEKEIQIKACVLWIHGGGYAMGEPEQDVSFIKEFTSKGCVVVAPDYIKSVIKPFPAPFDDCYRVLLWMNENQRKLGCDTGKIIVGGDSAGGGLCIAVCLKARDEQSVKIDLQIPIYPMISYKDTESSKANYAPVWNTKSNHLAWDMYLGGDYKNVSKYAAPSLETNYSNLPPAVTYVGNLDPFVDETIDYIKNLNKACVNAEVLVLQGAFHGFDIVAKKSKSAIEARKFLNKCLNKHL